MTPEEARKLFDAAPEVAAAKPTDEARRAFDAAPELLPASPATEQSADRTDEAALQGFGQGATFGFLPWLQARAEQVIKGGEQAAEGFQRVDSGAFARGLGNVAQGALSVTGLGPLVGLTPNTPEFEISRQQFAAREKGLERQHPGVSAASNVVGGIFNPVTLATGGGGMVASKGLGQAMAQGAKLGLATGAAQGAGDVASEGLQGTDALGRLAAQTGMGAVGGGIGGGIVYGLGRGVSALKALPGTLKEAAETRAVKSMGPYAAELNKVTRGTKDWSEVQDMGRTMLDQKMVRPFDNAENVAERLAGMEEVRGKAVQESLESLAALPGGQNAASYPSLEKRIREAAQTEARNVARKPYVDELLSEASKMEQIANPSLEQMKAGTMPVVSLSLPEAEALKRSYQATTNYATQAAGADARKTIAALARQEVEDSAQKTAVAAGKPELFDDFIKAKAAYADVAKPLGVARPAVFRQERNRFISPSDYGFGLAAGIATGGQQAQPLGMAAIGAMLHKLVRERGSSAAAVGLDNASKAMASTGDALAPLLSRLSPLASPAIKRQMSQVPGELDDLLFGSETAKPATPPGTDEEEKKTVASRHFVGAQ